MAYHSDLIAQEAAVIDIVEAKQWREKMAIDATSAEKDRLHLQRTSLRSWLSLEQPPQDDERERLLRDCIEGSCDWILKTQVMESWLKADTKNPVVWLHGKPGAGKSVICASMLESLQGHDTTTLSYFCKYHEHDSASKILKRLILELIETNSDLAAVAFSNFVEKYREPSLKILPSMLTGSPDKPGLLQGVAVCRIVVDGLDECDAAEQKFVIDNLVQFVSTKFADKLEKEPINKTIHAFAEGNIQELIDEKPSLRVNNDTVQDLTHIIVERSNGLYPHSSRFGLRLMGSGMFLWAKLVLDSVCEVDSVWELNQAITTMPRELPELYDRILSVICQRQAGKQTEKIMRVLAWVTLARRPLKRQEILHGVGVTTDTPVLNRWNVLGEGAIDKCKPLVEELSDGSIAFIHFTAREYFSIKFERSLNTWHTEIIFSCVAVLRESLLLADPESNTLEKLLGVLNGSHALLPYSADFWVEHLLDCATVTNITAKSPLGLILDNFYWSHKQVALKLSRPLMVDTPSQHTADARVSVLSHLPIASFCASILDFRAECRAKSAGTEFEALAKDRDPTLLNYISSQYNQHVNSLLSVSELEGIPEEQPRHFQSQYSRHAFRCRFKPCTNTSLGFPTEPMRDSHEQLHIKRLFCDKPSCARGRIGFKQQRELDMHNKAYHTEGSILIPPRVQRIAANTLASHDREVFHDPESEPSNAISQKWKINRIQIPFDRSFRELASMEAALDRVQLSSSMTSKTEKDWGVIFNAQAKPAVDVHLQHRLMHDYPVYGVRIDGKSRRFATDSEQRVQIFDLLTGERICLLQHQRSESGGREMRSLCFSPDGTQLVTEDGIDLMRVWDLTSETVICSFDSHEDTICAVDFAPNGAYVASVSLDMTAQTWNPVSGEIYHRWAAPGGLICVSISPDSLRIAAGCLNDCFLRLGRY
ncbi:Fc.00g113350.m01.CDS01 [Cosmosporella sp. VM-42]